MTIVHYNETTSSIRPTHLAIMNTTHVLYSSNNKVFIFFLELNSSFAQSDISIQNNPQRWPFTHTVAAVSVVLVNLILNLLLLYACCNNYSHTLLLWLSFTFTAMIKAKAVTLEELQKADGGWFTIKPAVTIVALCWDRYSYHRCVECRMRALPNAEGKYGCAQHPTAKTKEIYCLRILLRQDDLNMWVTAFADVAELITGVSVEEFHAFDHVGRKIIAWGVRGLKCNMTIGKTVGAMYTNYTVQIVEFAGYLPWLLMRTHLVTSLEVWTTVAKRFEFTNIARSMRSRTLAAIFASSRKCISLYWLPSICLNSRTLFGVCTLESL